LQPRRIASGGLGCFSLLAGCGADETKTTGTQLQISSAREALFGAMEKGMQKDRAELKSQRAPNKKA